MKLNEQDRDLFAAFGEPDLTEIDLTLAETASNENEAPIYAPMMEEIEQAAAAPAEAAQAKAKPFKTGFSWAAFTGGLAAFIWVAGAVGGPIAYFGVEAVMAMEPTLQAGLIALAFGPAMLFWLGGAAAGEAFKARKLAAEITRIAQTSFNPFEGSEDHARRLTESVKTEIDALNNAVAVALARLDDFKSAARDNVAIFDDAVAISRQHVDHMTSNLARERDSIVELNGELRGQTETMAHSIGRQVRLMREASKLVKTELGAAEDALESHLTAFASSAQQLSERTSAIHDAAHSSHAANAALSATMHGMLDTLGQATQLTEAARCSAEDARAAANDAAVAINESAEHAVIEAKRAAQLIRAESEAMQEAANDTMARLQMAADAARAASDESQAAADRHAASIERRLSALAQTATAKKPAPKAEARVEVKPEPKFEQKFEPRYDTRPAPRSEERARATLAQLDAVERAPLQGSVHVAARNQARREDARGETPAQRGFSAFGRWSNPFADKRVEEQTAEESLELMRFEAAQRAAQPKVDPDAQIKSEALQMMVAAGVDLEAALTAADLERVAQRSRLGALARRQAVVDAAPHAVNRILRHLKRNAEANAVAEEFRARPDLAKSDKKGEASDLVRAYLLVDAALD